MSEHYSVESALAHRKTQIDERVALAFDYLLSIDKNNSQLSPLWHEKHIFAKDIEEAEKLRAALQQKKQLIRSDDEVYLEINDEVMMNQVVIWESHLYQYLLEKAFDTAAERSNVHLNEDWKRFKISQILDHEYLHATPGLDQPGLGIGYGVTFYKDEVLGGISIEPMIYLQGILAWSVYQDILTNPDPHTLSSSDRMRSNVDE